MPPPLVQESDLEPEDNERYNNENIWDDDPSPGHRSPYLSRTNAFRKFQNNLTPQDRANRCTAAIDYLASTWQLDITLLLDYVSWGLETDNKVIKYARTALMMSEELPRILQRWHCPPREHGRGIRTKAGRKVMTEWAADLTKRRLNSEMSALAPLLRSPPSELSEESLLQLNLQEMIREIKETAPTLWSMCRSLCYTPLQDQRNTNKSPDTVTLILL